MKKITLLIVMLFAVVAFAGEKEELQLQLDKAILQINNANLQFQLRAQDDPGIQAAKQALNTLGKSITDKGYLITQTKDGGYVISEKPKEQVPAVPPPKVDKK